MKKRAGGSASFGVPGAVSLMVVFCVLCISVFSILILSTCLADRRRAEQSAALSDGYYEADSTAETIIAGMRCEGVTGYQKINVPISDTMELCVEVNIGESVEVISWKTASTKQWNADNTLQVAEIK